MKLSFADFPLEYFPEVKEDLPRRLRLIRECGFTCIDFNITDSFLGEDYAERAAELKSELACLGMSAEQAHAPIINPFDEKSGDYMGTYTRALEFCALVGIPQVVIHAGAKKGNTREEYFESNAAFYRSLIPAAEKTGVRVLVENIGHAGDDNFLLLGTDICEMLDRIGHPLFTACWDTGHGNLNRQNLYETVLALGARLTALHVHDNCAYFEPSYRHHRIDMHTTPFATQYASVNYDALLQGLADIGYKGTFNFEVLTMTRAIRPDFVRDGKVVRTLEQPPLSLWVKANSLLFETGKYMLSAYGLFEE
jgi:sugar phosphate isomerase/epimerase